jgi:DNA polymerase III delta subunit
VIYLFHGSDKKRSLARARELTDALLVKRPGALVFRVQTDPWDAGRFEELLVSGGLFAPAHVVVLNGVLAVSASAEAALESLADMKESGNVFVWVEGEIDEPKLKPITAVAEKVVESRGTAKATPIETNRFALADAVVGRDKKQAWRLLIEALADAVAEEVHGIVWWGVKSALLASRAATPEESGQKPFVHGKFKRMAAKWPEGELARFADRLVDVYHRAHEGRGDLGRGMEKAVLESC